eukprot:gene30551-biopygen16392
MLSHFQIGPRQSRESIAVPKCPNARSLEIHHFPGLSFEGPFPASMRSLEVTLADYDRLYKGALHSCTGLEELTLYGCEALQRMPLSLAGFSKLQTPELLECQQLTDISALGSYPNLQNLNLAGRWDGCKLVDIHSPPSPLLLATRQVPTALGSSSASSTPLPLKDGLADKGSQARRSSRAEQK